MSASAWRTQIKKSFDHKLVYVNGSVVLPKYTLMDGDIVEFRLLRPDEITLKPHKAALDILFEDDDIIVLNKPAGVVVYPGNGQQSPTFVEMVLSHCKLSKLSGPIRPGIVHRLDKNTSGLMIAIKNDEIYQNISDQIKQKTLIRKYRAIVLGAPFEEKAGIINKPLLHYMKDNVKMVIAQSENEGIDAVTNYKVLEEYKGASLVELELKTGRTHQIRVHMSSINHPVFGDSLYGAKSYMINEFYNLKTNEQLLQSYYISFTHPKTNKRMEFELNENEYSEDFIKVLKFLRSKK